MSHFFFSNAKDYLFNPQERGLTPNEVKIPSTCLNHKGERFTIPPIFSISVKDQYGTFREFSNRVKMYKTGCVPKDNKTYVLYDEDDISGSDNMSKAIYFCAGLVSAAGIILL